MFWGSKITADGDCSHEIKRQLLLGKKVMTNLHSMLKSRDITLSTKVCLVKAMVFPVVMYGCESWTIKKVESESEVAQSCLTLCDPMDTRLLCPWDFLGKGSGVGCHFLLQGIFPTQGSSPGLPHSRQTLLSSEPPAKLSTKELMLLNCGVGDDS